MRDLAEILLDGRSRWTVDHLPVWSPLAEGLADQGRKVNSQNFDSKYLKNGDRYEVGPLGALSRRTHRLSIGTVRFDLA